MTQADIQKREDLISQLKNIDNSLILQRISDFLEGVLAANSANNDFWKELPDSVKDDYHQGLKEMEAGEEDDVKDFLKKYRK